MTHNPAGSGIASIVGDLPEQVASGMNMDCPSMDRSPLSPVKNEVHPANESNITSPGGPGPLDKSCVAPIAPAASHTTPYVVRASQDTDEVRIECSPRVGNALNPNPASAAADAAKPKKLFLGVAGNQTEEEEEFEANP